MKCERCGEGDTYTDDAGNTYTVDLLDYCASCSKNLCTKCMSQGCCGSVPAESGMSDDYDDKE